VLLPALLLPASHSCGIQRHVWKHQSVPIHSCPFLHSITVKI
jgi:hypothetical protein